MRLNHFALLIGLVLAAPSAPVAAADSGQSSQATAGSPTTQVLEADPIWSEKIKLLPPPAREVYITLPFDVKQLLDRTLKQETTLIPGVVVINHENAFIKGVVMRHNVFDFVNHRIDTMVNDGKLNPTLAPPLHKFFETARTLTPDQRSVVTVLLSREMELAHS